MQSTVINSTMFTTRLKLIVWLQGKRIESPLADNEAKQSGNKRSSLHQQGKTGVSVIMQKRGKTWGGLDKGDQPGRTRAAEHDPSASSW